MKIKSRVIDKVGGVYVEVSKDMNKAIRKVIRDHLRLIRAEAVELIDTITPGKDTTRKDKDGDKRQVTVSRPGDAPNRDTGELSKSIQMVIDRRTYQGFVYSDAQYARKLEFHQNRKFLGPALKEHEDSFLPSLHLAIAEVIRKADR